MGGTSKPLSTGVSSQEREYKHFLRHRAGKVVAVDEPETATDYRFFNGSGAILASMNTLHGITKLLSERCKWNYVSIHALDVLIVNIYEY